MVEIHYQELTFLLPLPLQPGVGVKSHYAVA